MEYRGVREQKGQKGTKKHRFGIQGCVRTQKDKKGQKGTKKDQKGQISQDPRRYFFFLFKMWGLDFDDFGSKWPLGYQKVQNNARIHKP